MAYFDVADQEILFAANGSLLTVLAVSGEYAKNTFAANSHLADFGYFEPEIPDDLPIGIYLWKGRVNGETGGWCGSEPVDADETWQGEWKPATLEQLWDFLLREGNTHDEALPLESSHWACDVKLLFPSPPPPRVPDGS